MTETATDSKPKSYGTIYLTGFVVLVILIAIVLVLFYSGIGSQVNLPTAVTRSAASGFSLFAIFYILAQVIERLIEPFSNSPLLGGHDEPGNDAQKNARFVSIWCIASGLGILLCYLTVGLFQLVNISFFLSPLGGHLWDAILSGVVVGAGTKPLHDLINVIDKNG